MARKKPRIKGLLISSPKGIDLLQPLITETVNSLELDLQLELYNQANNRDIIVQSRQRDKDFLSIVKAADILLVDVATIPFPVFFDLGIARAIGKPILYISETFFLNQLPDFVRQGNVLVYSDPDNFKKNAKAFFKEYAENPKRFAPRKLIESDISSQIVVDIDRLEQRDFENLCFELLTRLGYNQVEWQIKDEFVDAVTTLKKRDPDGFEYDEFWLISFRREFLKDKMFDLAIHDPEYFIERVYRSILNSDMISSNRILHERSDVPITLLLILRGKENHPKRLIRELSKRDFRINKRGYPFTIRIRWWDEQIITSLVQNNQTLARKYFSTDSASRSSVRLSYEELYKQYADKTDELQIANQQLLAERNKAQLLERDAAWKLMSFTAAHRLGNPMDAIDSELSNLKEALKLGRMDMIEDIAKSMEIPVERAKSIVSEFRNLSLAQEIKTETVTSKKLHEILKYSGKQAIDKSVKVKFNLKDIQDISLDIQKVPDCFDEIVRNALHFINGDDQEITISLANAKKSELPEKLDKIKQYIKISFSDNGCGVPYDKKQKIFQPFERNYIHGTGLGLAYCENIIEKHGGFIRENGKPEEGANFEIFLPIN